MKIGEVRTLTIGSIVANKLNQYKIVNINKEDGKIVSFHLEGIYAQLNTDNLNRTIKLDSMRKYELVELAEEEEIEEEEIPNMLVVPTQLSLPAPAPQPMYKESQIITDMKELNNYFIRRIIPVFDSNHNMSYEYTMCNMHTNEVVTVVETIIASRFELTTNELMEKVASKHNSVEEKPVLHVHKQANKTAKTDNDILLNALREVLEGAKKSEVCNKYGIPSYIFSRVLNFKHGRPSLRGAVYELCKKYNKLDIIKHIELYEEA